MLKTPAQRESAVVRRIMDTFASRGVFRSYGARELPRGRVEYQFLWLADQPFTMIHDPARSTLTFRDVLPGIDPRSPLDRRLREFISERKSADLPDHRRIDSRRVRARCLNRAGNVSLILDIQPASADYGARKAIELVNEIFFGYLLPRENDYMVRRFNLPEE